MENHATVTLKWLVGEGFPFPKDRQFSCTGFLADEGDQEMISVIVKIPKEQDIESASEAQLFALVDEMSHKLPSEGELFMLTSGMKAVAECRGVTAPSRND